MSAALDAVRPPATKRRSEFTLASVWALVACFLGNAISAAPIVNGSFGQFMLPLTHDFNWSRTAYTGVLPLLSAIGLIVYPLGGRMADRFGSRPVLVTGMLAYGLSMAAFYMMPPNLPAFYGLYFLVGLTSSIPSSVVLSRVISGWFVKRRGLALGITAGGGISAGYVVEPGLCQHFIDTLGWRGAYLAWGAIIICIGLPVVGLLLREASHSLAEIQAMDAATETGMTAPQVRRTARFWALLVAVTLGAGASTVFYTHIFPYGSDCGMPASAAIWAVSAAGLSNGLWQVVMGHILDRTPSPKLAAPMVLTGIAGLALITLTRDQGAWIAGGLLLGVSSGSEYGLVPYALQRYFGRAGFGELYGFIYGVVWLSMGVFPLLSALSFDLLKSYALALSLSGVCMAISAVLLFVLPAYGRLPKDQGR